MGKDTAEENVQTVILAGKQWELLFLIWQVKCSLLPPRPLNIRFCEQLRTQTFDWPLFQEVWNTTMKAA